MEKYKQAFEMYEAMVQRSMRDGMSEVEARIYWGRFADGIVEVAINDDDISMEQFEEILILERSWRNEDEK